MRFSVPFMRLLQPGQQKVKKKLHKSPQKSRPLKKLRNVYLIFSIFDISDHSPHSGFHLLLDKSLLTTKGKQDVKRVNRSENPSRNRRAACAEDRLTSQ